MEKYPEIRWPDEYSELKTMENLMKCQICYDYMDTPVITPCSHNYCSLCIRKYLHYRTRCPLCFKGTFENELRPNRILEEIIIHYAKLREKLKELIKEVKNEENDANKIDNNSNSIVNEVITPQSASRLLENNINGKKNEKEDDNNTLQKLNSSQTSEQCQFSPSKACSLEMIVENPSSKVNKANSEDQGNNNNKKVSCSVCQVDIPVIHIDEHTEVCSKRESNSEILSTTESKRQPLPKLVLNLMKDSELKKKMKELGLPTQGTRKILESRYLRYCTLYNAECDKKKPRNIAELLKRCKDDEALEKKLAKVS